MNNNWLPIDSAPKEPLVRFSDNHWSGPSILCCNDVNVRQGAAMTINHLSTLNAGKTWDWGFWQARTPTHWQPLPLPPKGDE